MFNQKMKILTAIIFSLAFFASFAQAQVCSPTPSGLVAWYPADGNANDISGNNNHGTLFGGAGFAAGMVGQGFQTDGGVRVLDSAVLRTSNAVTVEMWVRATTSPGINKYLLSKSLSDGVGSYALYSGSNGGLVFYIGLTEVIFIESPDAGTSVWDGNFHHVAGIYDGSFVRLYVDGVQVGTGTPTSGSIAYGTSFEKGDLFFNSFDSDPSSVVDFPAGGINDEVSIYNRALSGTEIQTIFNAGSAGKCKPVVTAASVSVSGRVLSPRGRSGISRARVYLTNAEGYTRSTFTNHFGYYRFADVEVGQTYIFSVFSKKYQFAPQVVTINEETENLNFSSNF